MNEVEWLALTKRGLGNLLLGKGSVAEFGGTWC